MGDTTLRDHLTIVAQLPDFVLGKLDETSLRRVSQHVEVCATCRDELANATDVLGLLADAPPPPARVRSAILQRAVAEYPGATRQGGAPRSALAGLSATGGGEQRLTSARSGQRHTSSGRFVPRWALVAAAAAVLLVSGLVGWGMIRRPPIHWTTVICPFRRRESSSPNRKGTRSIWSLTACRVFPAISGIRSGCSPQEIISRVLAC
jgi:hypothetical protein